MLPTLQADHIACQLLKLEQQLKAYEKLHADELTELWQTLNDCKQVLAAIDSASESPSSEESNDSGETVGSLASVTSTGST